jgi:hypothetical protein
MQQTIPSLPRAVADYVRALDLVAICAYRDGRIGVSRNPAGAAAAWWVKADQAGAVIRLAGKNGNDAPAAARRLGVALTEHAIALTRASARRGASPAAEGNRQGCCQGRHGHAGAGGERVSLKYWWHIFFSACKLGTNQNGFGQSLC